MCTRTLNDYWSSLRSSSHAAYFFAFLSFAISRFRSVRSVRYDTGIISASFTGSNPQGRRSGLGGKLVAHLFPEAHRQLMLLIVARPGPSVEDASGMAFFERFDQIETCWVGSVNYGCEGDRSVPSCFSGVPRGACMVSLARRGHSVLTGQDRKSERRLYTVWFPPRWRWAAFSDSPLPCSAAVI